MTDPATMHYAIATATALAGIGAATAWAIQAREADRARRDADRSLARQLAEINQAKLDLASAEKEIALLSTERDRLLRRAMAAEANAREWSDRAARAERDLAETDELAVQRFNHGNVDALREQISDLSAAAQDLANVGRLLSQLADAHPDEIVRGVPCETPHRAIDVARAFLDVLRYYAATMSGKPIRSAVPPGIHPLPLFAALVYRDSQSQGMRRFVSAAARAYLERCDAATEENGKNGKGGEA